MKPDGYNLYPLGGAILKGGRPNPRGANAWGGRTIYQTIAQGTAIADSAALTPFDQTGSVPAGFLNVVGAILRVEASGFYGTTGTPGITFQAAFDDIATGPLLANPAIVALTNNAVANGWRFNVDFVVRTIGATGTGQPCPGYAIAANQTTGVAVVSEQFNSTLVNFNTASVRQVVVGVQWGAADPANSITMTSLTLSVDYPLVTA